LIFKNFNYFNYFNFFFFNYFNSIFFYFFLKTPSFFKNFFVINDLQFFKKFNFKKKNFFFIKYYKFLFISKFDSNNNNKFITSFIKFSRNGLIYFDPLLIYFIKFFNKFLLSFFDKNYNFLILDSQYKYNFFIYNKIFNLKDLVNYKMFFFPKYNYFCKKNWVFFFKLFCKFFNISFFFINEFKFFSSYYNELAQIDIPTAAIIPQTYKNIQVDYPIFFNNNDFNFVKYLFYVTIYNVYFYNLNYKFYFYKLNYFFKFKKII